MAHKVTRALVSVSDKTGLTDLCRFLTETLKVEVLSTGGTAKALRDAGIAVREVSDYTGFPEMLDGRVKTLHPLVHGALLGVRGKAEHETAMAQHKITPIDLVVVNLYPFEANVAKGADYETCVENIDIGGPAMIRSASKNHASVSVLTNPSQYSAFVEELKASSGSTFLDTRKKLAAAAYATTAAYDSAIAQWFATQTASVAAPTAAPATVSRSYAHVRELKYGNNPHEKPAGIYSIKGHSFPLKVLHGAPGYINLLDACNSYQLVSELKQSLGKAAAASFKHVSPAGAAVAVPLSAQERDVYDLGDKQLSNAALAYLRARQADPMCSFGDWAALSDVVDEDTAMVLKTEVSDGIIAPGFTEKAIEILSSKKNGAYILIQAAPDFKAPDFEMREVYGVGFYRRRNDCKIEASLLNNFPTKEKHLSAQVKEDLILANIAVKYTQSNSVGYAKNGQMIGVGAGQQSRVDCVKLAGRKVETWWMRFHPKVRELPFKAGTKRVDKVNARVRYIEGDFTEAERTAWLTLFERAPPALTQEDKEKWMKTLTDVSVWASFSRLSSDAFFPFRDSIDAAARRGVKYVIQPGGSVADAEVVQAADSYGMTMAFTNLRLFHH